MHTQTHLHATGLSVASCSTAAAAFSRSHLLLPEASTCASCLRSCGSEPPSASPGLDPPTGPPDTPTACAVCTGERCMHGGAPDRCIAGPAAAAAARAAAAAGAAVLLLIWLLCAGDMLGSSCRSRVVLAGRASLSSGMSCSRCRARVAAACTHVPHKQATGAALSHTHLHCTQAVQQSRASYCNNKRHVCKCMCMCMYVHLCP